MQHCHILRSECMGLTSTQMAWVELQLRTGSCGRSGFRAEQPRFCQCCAHGNDVLSAERVLERRIQARRATITSVPRCRCMIWSGIMYTSCNGCAVHFDAPSDLPLQACMRRESHLPCDPHRRSVSKGCGKTLLVGLVLIGLALHTG